MWGRKHLARLLPAWTFRGRAGQQPFGRSILVNIAQASLVLMVWHALPGLYSSQADDVQKANSSSTAATTAPDGPTRTRVTRADLAAAYLRLEQAFFAHQPARDEIARINKSFDQATRAFFLGSNADAIRTIDALTESLAMVQLSPAERALASVKMVVEPPVWPAGRPLKAICRVASLYEWPSAEPLDANLQLRLVNSREEHVLDLPFAVTLGTGHLVDMQLPLEVADDRLAPGLCRIELVFTEGRGFPAARVNVIDGALLNEQRRVNEKRLAQLEFSTPKMAQALASCRARNQLLNDRPSEDNSAQFLSDLNGLAIDVESEIEALESGEDPYFRRRGDCWRVFQVGGVPPVYVPA